MGPDQAKVEPCDSNVSESFKRTALTRQKGQKVPCPSLPGLPK